jgi:hypothetical protein
MRPLAVVSSGVVVAALVLVATAGAMRSAESYAVDAKLNAAQEIPKQVVSVPRAKGKFTSQLTESTEKAKTGSLRWRLTFSNLSGKAMAAHIHRGKPGKAGPIMVPLCGPCASGAHGVAKLDAKTMNAIKSGSAYVNVHTAKNPNGEIRGQLHETGT